MAENKSRPPQDQPWENGWAPDTSRAPGTRRLWLAGAMAAATIVACVTAIAVTERAADDESRSGQAADNTAYPGLISFATPSQTTPPKGKSGLSTARPTTSAPRDQDADDPEPAPEPSKSPSSQASPPAPRPTAAVTWRSVRSVNYPDRYWHVSGGYVKLDPVGGAESREDSTFKLVNGLAQSSCYSFATADGTYLRHRSFVLRAERDDGSAVFEQDATFCPRTSAYSGSVMLESVNYPGRFLRHQNFQLKLDPFQNSSLYLADSAFQLVGGLA
ncbi:AbfB domain-containing protein [Streptomyces sp. ISL-22]|uniref:Alpha-L-arabinofuranosidase n=1 Tax=Streptomyces curacoi TaxID=146536 RepID=A0A124H7X4_9ACTN|nr:MULTISPECIES: AbfB domain-containing protein [Streptomyces]KUM81890.1 alpha-L-arabinofuranosidase [Streptomyces curacoi]MBT2417691.1 AbfB domain-containing protein [Streptomyces sp. ISL-24]MBT2433343.1 AbfB domain-containing protein [Streptomyces sp. ISL-22]